MFGKDKNTKTEAINTVLTYGFCANQMTKKKMRFMRQNFRGMSQRYTSILRIR
jgi:hypothetical protein